VSNWTANLFLYVFCTHVTVVVNKHIKGGAQKAEQARLT